MSSLRWLRLLLVITVLLTVFSFLTTMPRQSLPIGTRADRIVVMKHSHTLYLLSKGTVLKSYQVALGRGGLAPKRKRDDNLVPEGIYSLTGRNEYSAFHRSLRIGYPTPVQNAEARAAGVDPGSDVMLHGICNGLGWLGRVHRTVDWTRGCIAVTDDEIEEIWRAVPNGTPIDIRP
ncbi:L,D-transpeptidase family protein [Terriglobus tenax]|uniref:L,D-transpeptidase family protein n=1 Tax=Terriglobus tenax TaxID=1111115 RepID=UPI0021DFC3ED|nr:L,D-transpeptidase family protein [Terriglobus tenax]